MKKLIIVMMVFFMAGSSMAQDHDKKHDTRTAEEKAKSKTEHMRKELGLSDEQTEKLYEINLQTIKQLDEKRAEMREQMKRMKEEREKMREEKKEIFEESDKNIGEILTDEQKDKYDEMKAKKKEEMEARHRERKMKREEFKSHPEPEKEK